MKITYIWKIKLFRPWTFENQLRNGILYARASADCVPFKDLFLVASEMYLKELVSLSSSFPHFRVNTLTVKKSQLSVMWRKFQLLKCTHIAKPLSYICSSIFTDRMIKQLLKLIIAKYRDLSVLYCIVPTFCLFLLFNPNLVLVVFLFVESKGLYYDLSTTMIGGSRTTHIEFIFMSYDAWPL